MGAPVGNTNAAGKRIWSDAIKKELSGARNEKRLRAIARKLIDMAENGDMSALKELGDRLEGKPAQAIDMTVKDITHEEALEMLKDDK